MQKAQFIVITKQAGLFYLIFWTNLAVLGYLHYGLAPLWLVLAMPLVIPPIAIARSIFYSRKGRRDVSLEEAAHRLRPLDPIICLTMTATACWALALAQYGTETSRVQILCFIILQTMSLILGLLHLPATAIKASMPFVAVAVIFFVFEGGSVRMLSAVFILAAMVSVVLSMVYYDIFLSRVLQNDQLRTLGNENLRLANTDLLTNLPNRRNFLHRLTTELEVPAPMDPIHLALIDLDGFKPVNDIYGHLAGDAVLKEVGRRLQAFEPGCVVARLGGDEFGIILFGGSTSAERLGAEIAASLRQPYALAQGSVNVGATLGIASADDAKGDLVKLLENADYALYEGKTAGRNQTVTFDIGHQTALYHRSRLEQTLRDADLEQELSLQFQPIVCAVSGKTVMFEALARWESPVLGIVSPQDFIIAAETSDLIVQLTEILLVKALAATARWPSDIGLSFNLSAQDLINPSTAARVSNELAAAGVAPQRVTFELTETALIRDFAQAQDTIQALKALGAQIAIDDFGTGYSSLAYVHRLPIDKLKIDRSFICDLDDDKAGRAIVKSIIGLCRSQGLDCVAEGVETESQALILRSLGCTLLQGYGPGRPIWEADIASFILAAPSMRTAAFVDRPQAFDLSLQWQYA